MFYAMLFVAIGCAIGIFIVAYGKGEAEYELAKSFGESPKWSVKIPMTNWRIENWRMFIRIVKQETEG